MHPGAHVTGRMDATGSAGVVAGHIIVIMQPIYLFNQIGYNR